MVSAKSVCVCVCKIEGKPVCHKCSRVKCTKEEYNYLQVFEITICKGLQIKIKYPFELRSPRIFIIPKVRTKKISFAFIIFKPV